MSPLGPPRSSQLPIIEVFSSSIIHPIEDSLRERERDSSIIHSGSSGDLFLLLVIVFSSEKRENGECNKDALWQQRRLIPAVTASSPANLKN